VAPWPLVTVVEVPQFIARANRLLTPDEHDALIAHLAANPTAGDLVVGAGGIRKLRWALRGGGKRGGARVIHFFHSPELTKTLVETYRKEKP
jgi:hypothetical protein